MINIFFLQVGGFFEELGRMIGLNPSATEFKIPVVPDIMPYFVIIGIIAVVVLYWRFNKNMKDFPNAESRVGKFSFLWMGSYEFTGNVSRLKAPLAPDLLEILMEEPRYKEGIEKLNDLVSRRQLFAYEINLTEWADALHLKGKDSIILISPVDIAQDQYSWEDTKQKINFGLMAYEQKRYVSLFESTHKFEVEDLNDEIREVIVITPIPRYSDAENEAMKLGKDLKELGYEERKLVVNQIGSMKAIAELIPRMVGVAKSLDMLKTRNISIEKLSELLSDKDDKIAELTNDLSEARAIASMNPLIGERPRKFEPEGRSSILWYLLFGAGGAGGTQLPQNVPELAQLDPMMGAVIGILFVTALFYITHRGNNNNQDRTKYLEK